MSKESIEGYNKAILSGYVKSAEAFKGMAIVLARKQNRSIHVCYLCVAREDCYGLMCALGQQYVAMDRAWAIKERKHGLCARV
jgi:pyridoxal/pyridoxine/pyridoxamine kinase